MGDSVNCSRINNSSTFLKERKVIENFVKSYQKTV